MKGERAIDELSQLQKRRFLEGRSLPLKPLSREELKKRQEAAIATIKRFAVTRGL